ncbi:hypothetical protein [Serratia bockelmannii]|uniref:hypothetical protein n=1 Tax=Serratia bockelmannii TaxID=2703793 RepID=UPI003FA6AF93
MKNTLNKITVMLPSITTFSVNALATPTLTLAQKLADEIAAVGVDRFTSHDYKPNTVIRHMVLFRYLNSTTEQQKKRSFNAS